MTILTVVEKTNFYGSTRLRKYKLVVLNADIRQWLVYKKKRDPSYLVVILDGCMTL